MRPARRLGRFAFFLVFAAGRTPPSLCSSFHRGHPCRWASPTFAMSSGQSLEYHDRLLNSLSLLARFGEHFVDVHTRSISSQLKQPGGSPHKRGFETLRQIPPCTSPWLKSELPGRRFWRDLVLDGTLEIRRTNHPQWPKKILKSNSSNRQRRKES
jgi:hypothetical protein